jgi:hypothetical protein
VSDIKRKPPRAGLGRPKGAKNKIPRDLKEYVMETAARLEEEGKGLYEWAKENPSGFWEKVFKGIVPKPVEVDHSGTMMHVLDFRRKQPKCPKND